MDMITKSIIQNSMIFLQIEEFLLHTVLNAILIILKQLLTIDVLNMAY
jgi:hypothetical protein